MHDTGSHTSGGDTSCTGHAPHASHGPAEGQAGWQQFTPDAADLASYPTGYYTGAGAGRRRAPSAVLLMILVSAVLPVAFALISVFTH